MQAIEDRTRIAAAAKAFFTRHDLLIAPVMPVPAYATGRDTPGGFAPADWSWCPYTYPWNMTGQPALSVPIGFTRAGLPVGVQIVGARGAEPLILRAAEAIERARPLWQRHPALAGQPPAAPARGAVPCCRATVPETHPAPANAAGAGVRLPVSALRRRRTPSRPRNCRASRYSPR